MGGVAVARDIRGASTSRGTFEIGVGDMSVFVDAAQLGLLVAMSGMAGISGLVLVKSIEEADAGSAWIWGTVFGASSLAAALSFWRLV